jgi:uncharacterized protein (TIRG00374 family)
MENKPVLLTSSYNPFRTIVGFAISAILLWLTVQQSGLQLQQLNLWGLQRIYFLLAIIAFVISVSLYTLRANLVWVAYPTLLRPPSTYSSIAAGNFYNCLLPGNLGDAIRAWHYSRKASITFTRSLAAVATEKWIDAHMFTLLAIGLFLLKPFIYHFILYAIYFTAVTVVILAVVYWFLQYHQLLEKKIWRMVLSLRKTGKFLYRLYAETGKHLHHLFTTGNFFMYMVYCFGLMFMNIMQFYFLLHAAGVNPPVGTWYTAFLTAVSMMVIAFIPSAPGNIGVLHYGIYSTLLLAAAQNNYTPTATDLQSYALYGVYIHLSYIIPDMIIGLYFIATERKLIF